MNYQIEWYFDEDEDECGRVLRAWRMQTKNLYPEPDDEPIPIPKAVSDCLKAREAQSSLEDIQF